MGDEDRSTEFAIWMLEGPGFTEFNFFASKFT